jgi:hypothetical protein
MANTPPRTGPRANPTDRNVGDLNLDPLTDEPGSHPVGTGLGAAGGAIAGAAVGAAGGPVGAAAGAVDGAIVGGVAGHAAGDAANPTVNPQAEDEYWRSAYVDAPYYSAGRTYDDYAPAYRLGYTSRSRFDGAFDDHEPALSREWEGHRGESRLSWDEARAATRDAWERITVEAPRGRSFDRS